MIAGALLILSTSWAGDPLVRPPAPVSRPDECPQSIPVRIGERPEGLIWDSGEARCSGVLLPSSQVADLLSVEVHRDAIEQLAIGDVALLKAQRAELQAQLRQSRGPWVHRLVAGAVGVTLGVGVGLTVGAYYTGPGGA